MSVGNAFRFWGYVGGLLAVILLACDRFRPFPAEINLWIDKATYALCPMWAWGFAGLTHTSLQWSAVTVLVNALFYGLLGAIAALIYKLLQELSIFPRR